MARSLIPPPLVEDCVEVHLARHAPTGRALSLTILALTLSAAGATAIVQVPVTVQATGVIRPVVERQDARVAENGVVRAVHVREGDRVVAGDTLLALDDRAVNARLAASDSIARAREDELADLAMLLDLGDSIGSSPTLRTANRHQQWREHAAISAELSARVEAEQKELERLQALFERGFVTAEQVEREESGRRTATAALSEHLERNRSAWSDAHARLADELRRLAVERAELADALARHLVIAPVDGTVEMAASLSPGSVLQRGERVATLSPNTELNGEALLSARDIALVGRGTPVRLMIDALNYRDWGTVEATVVEVADDATLASDQPVFRVRCRLARSELRLRGGQSAALKKGMTFRARFIVAQRSLLQLLFDGVDDWLNPARAPYIATAAR